jgi:multimeric flavodoxin WrbA
LPTLSAIQIMDFDQAGGLWARGALNGKDGGAFTSTATQHGGQEVMLAMKSFVFGLNLAI